MSTPGVSTQGSNRGMTPESSFYGGMFREEIAQQLLESCTATAMACFRDLYQQCERKHDGEAVFRNCVDMVRTGWVEEDFTEELKCAPTDFDAQVRGSFIVFVRQTYTDATGGSTVHVRVTVPPTVAFLREFLRAISRDEDLRSGAFFNRQTRLEHKDVVMQAIRGAMKTLCTEFVYVADQRADAMPSAVPDSVSGDEASEQSEDDSDDGDDDDGGKGHKDDEQISKDAVSDISVNIKNSPPSLPRRSRRDEDHRSVSEESSTTSSKASKASKASKGSTR